MSRRFILQLGELRYVIKFVISKSRLRLRIMCCLLLTHSQGVEGESRVSFSLKVCKTFLLLSCFQAQYQNYLPYGTISHRGVVFF